MGKQAITVIIRLRLFREFIVPGMRDLEVFAELVRQHEPACQSVEIAQDIDDPTQITMIERWSDRDAYEGPHLQTPHMKAFIAESSRYFEGPADVSFLRGKNIRRERRQAEPYGR